MSDDIIVADAAQLGVEQIYCVKMIKQYKSKKTIIIYIKNWNIVCKVI